MSPLAGQVLTEGSLALSRDPLPVVAEPSEDRGKWMWFFGSATAAVMLVGLLVVLSVTIGGVTYSQGMWGQSATAETPVPGAVEPSIADPVPAITDDSAAPATLNPAATPDAEPPPVAPVPEPRVPGPRLAAPEPIAATPVPEPVVEPDPLPRAIVVVPRAPDPLPVVVTTAVTVSGDAPTVWLTGQGGRVNLLPGGSVQVPVGAWTLHSSDPVGGARQHGGVRVVDGAPVSIGCSNSMMSCRVR